MLSDRDTGRGDQVEMGGLTRVKVAENCITIHERLSNSLPCPVRLRSSWWELMVFYCFYRAWEVMQAAGRRAMGPRWCFICYYLHAECGEEWGRPLPNGAFHIMVKHTASPLAESIVLAKDTVIFPFQAFCFTSSTGKGYTRLLWCFLHPSWGHTNMFLVNSQSRSVPIINQSEM